MPRYEKKDIRPYPGPGYLTTPPTAGQYIDTAGTKEARSLALFAGLSQAAAKVGKQWRGEKVEQGILTGATIAAEAPKEKLKDLEAYYRELEATGEYIITPPMMKGAEQMRARLWWQEDQASWLRALEELPPEHQQDPEKADEIFRTITQARRLSRGRPQTAGDGSVKAQGEDYFDNPYTANTYNLAAIDAKGSIVARWQEKAARAKKDQIISTANLYLEGGISNILGELALGEVKNPEALWSPDVDLTMSLDTGYSQAELNDATKFQLHEFISEFFNGDDSHSGVFGSGLQGADGGLVLSGMVRTILNAAYEQDGIDPEIVMEALKEFKHNGTDSLTSLKPVQAVLSDFKNKHSVAVAKWKQEVDWLERAQLTRSIDTLSLSSDPEFIKKQMDPKNPTSLYHQIQELYADPVTREMLTAELGISGDTALSKLTAEIEKNAVIQRNLRFRHEVLYGRPEYERDAAGEIVLDADNAPVPVVDSNGDIVYEAKGFVQKIVDLAGSQAAIPADLETMVRAMRAETYNGHAINWQGLSEESIIDTIEAQLSHIVVAIPAQMGEQKMENPDDPDGDLIDVPPSLQVERSAEQLLPLLESTRVLFKGPIPSLVARLEDAFSLIKRDPDVFPGVLSGDPIEAEEQMRLHKEQWGENYMFISTFARTAHEMIGTKKSYDILTSMIPTGSDIGEFFEKVHGNLENNMSLDQAMNKELVLDPFGIPDSNDTSGLASFFDAEDDDHTLRQQAVARLLKRTKGAVSDYGGPDNPNASTDLPTGPAWMGIGEPGTGWGSAAGHPENGLRIDALPEDQADDTVFPAQYAMQSIAFSFVSGLYARRVANNPSARGSGWVWAMREAEGRNPNQRKVPGQGIHILDNMLIFDQQKLYGQANVLESRYDVADNDMMFGGDSKNSANLAFPAFMTTPYEEGGLGYIFDANDKMDVGSHLVREYGDDLDAIDVYDMEGSRRKKYELALKDIPIHETFMMQSQDGDSCIILWGRDLNIPIGDPFPTKRFRDWYLNNQANPDTAFPDERVW